MSGLEARHIALQFGQVRHFNEGLSEFGRQLGLHIAQVAEAYRAERGWHFHFILPVQWHGMFGPHVHYVALSEAMRGKHRSTQAYDIWHGLHQHMRYKVPTNSAYRLITVHDLNHRYAKAGLSLWWQERRLRAQVGQADQVIAITRFVQQDIQAHWPWVKHCDVVHNGVADLSQHAREPIHDLLGRQYFLHISRMSPSKNVESILCLAKAWPDALFVLAGPASPEVDVHRARARSMGVRNVVLLTDVSEAQKAWLYAHCRGFIFPSLMEGFGMPPIEAMYFDKPVFLSRLTSLPEVGGACATYFDDFNPTAMKSTIERALLHGDEAILHPSIQARKYSWHVCLQAYLRQYELGLSKISAK
jgi:glycosyltransferase involved in cell wall biosynthesis